MIIDGHAHLGGEYKNLQAIISALDKSGVAKVVLCPADTARPESLAIPDLTTKIAKKELNFVVNRLIRRAVSKEQTQRNIESGNLEVFNISALSNGRIIQFFWANPLKESIINEIESKIESWKFRGIKLHQSCHPFKIISSQFNNIAEIATLKNLPVFIHLYSKKEVLDFISLSGNYKTPFIVGHLIGLEIFIQQKKKVSDNIFFDISCPPLVSAGRIDMAIKEFGPQKIVMGSDTPYGKNNLEQIISRIRSIKLRDEESEMILGNNLKDILRL